VQRQVRITELGLVGIGVAIGLMHLPLSLEVATTLSYQSSMVRTLIMLLYPIAMALTGLGAVLAMKVPALARPGALRVAGAALLVLLVAALRLNFLTDSPMIMLGAWITHLGAIGTWYLALGAGQAALLSRIQQISPERIGIAWAVHLVGLLLGYLLSEPSVVIIGANAVLLCGGLALLLAPRLSVLLLVPALLIASQTDLDMQLEQSRELTGDVGMGEDGWKEIRLREALENGIERIHLGWSRFGQVQVFNRGGRSLIFYNLKRQYELRPSARHVSRRGRGGQRNEVRSALYALIEATDRVMMIGVGGGRSLLLLERHPGIIAVERDPGAGRLFSEINPALNDNVFTEVTFQIADGRFAIETGPEQLDVIVLESSRYQPAHAMLPASSAYFLHTLEALQTYLDRLTPDGVLIAEFTRVGESSSHQRVPAHVVRTLTTLGAQLAIFRTGTKESVTLIASKEPSSLEKWAGAMRSSGAHELQEGWPAEWSLEGPTLTDDRPFAGWQAMQPPDRRRVVGIGGGLVLLTSLMALVMHRRSRQRPWNAVGWFFALGIAHTGLQLHAFHAWRTYFGDELRTVWWLIIAWLAYGAVGSALAERLARRRVVLMTASLVAAHLLLTALLPFSAGAVARVSYALIALLPGGLLMGMWMPLGLSRADADGLGTWLAADALGTLAGAAALYLLMVPLGGTAYLIPAVMFYLVIAIRWRP